MKHSFQYLLSLINAAAGLKPADGAVLSAAELEEMLNLAFDQCVNAIAADGYKVLSDKGGSSQDEDVEDLIFEWLGSVMWTEDEHKKYVKKVNELGNLFADNGFRPILLKGLGLGLDYPIPEHRHVGDVDIFLADGRSREGDRMIKEKLGLSVKKSRIGHHSHFIYRGIPVENHYELSNSYFGGKRTKKLEERLQELISTGLYKPFDNCPFLLPSADFNAAFLLWHMGTHFCSDIINMCQLCDWYFFLRAHHSEIDWPSVKDIWQEAGLMSFAQAIREFMIKAFLMPGEWMPVETSASSAAFADRILEDMLSGSGRKDNTISNVFHYMKNAWKYKLVTGQFWLKPMVDSIVLHLFRSEDLKELEIERNN